MLSKQQVLSSVCGERKATELRGARCAAGVTSFKPKIGQHSSACTKYGQSFERSSDDRSKFGHLASASASLSSLSLDGDFTPSHQSHSRTHTPTGFLPYPKFTVASSPTPHIHSPLTTYHTF